MLSGNDIPASDKRVRFVGLARYEAEGGLVRRDLFHEGEDGTYIADAAKLTRLVNEKLEAIREQVKAEGWKWVEVQPEADHQFLGKHKRIYAPELPLPPEAEAEIAQLEQERDTLTDQLNEDDADSEDCEDRNNEEIYSKIEDLDDRIRSIRRGRKRAYTEEVKAACGVVVSVGFHGEPEFCYGLLRKEDEQELANPTTPDDEAQPSVPICRLDKAEEHSPYSAPLVETLTMHKTAAIAVELTQNPGVALAAVVHALVLSEFGLDLQLYRSKSSLQISSSHPDLRGAEGSAAFTSLEEQRKDWFSKLPRKAGDLWRWCLEQNQDTLLRLLAFCAARSLNGIKAKADSGDSRDRLAHANALAVALAMDMSKWFTPTAENFFSKVSKARIREALSEAGKPPCLETEKLKKAQFAAHAEQQIQGTRWLPEPVRVSAIPGEGAGFSQDEESEDR